MVVASDTVSLLAIVSIAFIVMVGLAWFGIISQGLAFVVLALFAGFALYGYVLYAKNKNLYPEWVKRR